MLILLDTKWLFTVKDDNKKKTRLVVRGFQQIPGQDFMEIYSPAIQVDRLRLTIALAAIHDWKLE